MSSSRRDFFSSLTAAVFALLGWRPRSISATPGRKTLHPASVTGGSYMSYTYTGPRHSISTYDAEGRLISLCEYHDPTPLQRPAEQVHTSDPGELPLSTDVVWYTGEEAAAEFLNPPDRKDA